MVGISYLSTTLPSFTTQFIIEVKTLDIIIEDITCIATREMQNFSSSGEKYFTSEHSEFMSDIFFTHVC